MLWSWDSNAKHMALITSSRASWHMTYISGPGAPNGITSHRTTYITWNSRDHTIDTNFFHPERAKSWPALLRLWWVSTRCLRWNIRVTNFMKLWTKFERKELFVCTEEVFDFLLQCMKKWEQKQVLLLYFSCFFLKYNNKIFLLKSQKKPPRHSLKTIKLRL